MKKDAKILAAIGAFTLVIFIGIAFIFNRQSNPTAADPTRLERPDSYSIAPAGAVVSLVEFADYQCPACAATNPFLKELLTKYEGKVRFTFKHFPLAQHKNGRHASEAVEAAGAQGKFWEMGNMLYEKQREWESADDPSPFFAKYATVLGLNAEALVSSVKAEQYAIKIKQDVSDGLALGVNSTPTFYLDGLKVPFNNLDAAIAAAIAQSNR